MLTINNTLDGYLKDVEILGNTIQNEEDLADIRSVGDKVEGQELYEIPVLSCGKNLTTLDKMYDRYMSQNIPQGNRTIYEDGVLKLNWTGAEVDIILIDGVFKPNTQYTFTYYCKSVNDDTWQRSMIRCKYTDGSISYLSSNSTDNKEFSKQVLVTDADKTVDCIYVNLNNELWINQVQLEEGTVATSYEPYQEDKLTILSPVQLEKVGDVADRIIEKDGVWGVEKNVDTAILNGSEVWSLSVQTPYNRFLTKGICIKAVDGIGVLSSKYKSSSFIDLWNNLDKESIASHNVDDGFLSIRADYSNVEEFKNSLKSNNILIKYITTQPQFIPLPHDQQIKLRIFANKTNISFGCEIEGTIKAQVPKSLGATVNTHTEQINNLNKELDRVKKLEESTVSTVTTESDFTTVKATSNGYFEDVKLEGKTLVNLAPKYSIKWTHSGTWLSTFLTGTKNPVTNDNYKVVQDLKPNTEYTVVVNVKTNTQSGNINLNNYQQNTCVFKDSMYIKPSDIGVKTFKVKTVESFDHISPSNMVVLRSQSAGISNGETLIEDIMILEGDHTQNPPSGYIEGLKSVGEDTDEIVVSSVNENLLKPLHTGQNIQYLKNVTFENDYSINYYAEKWGSGFTVEVLGVVQGETYVVKCDSASNGGFRGVSGSALATSNDVPMSSGRVEVVATSSGKGLIRFKNAIELGNISFKNLRVVKKGSDEAFKPQTSDKKRLLYYNNETQTWEKPILREWDSIEKHSDGKYYYHQRSGEVVLNGSVDEKWVKNVNISNGNYAFMHLQGQQIKPSNSMSDFICDKLVVRSYNVASGECISKYTNGTELVIKVTASKLSTQDVNGFKQWLQANNVTVVYQLAQEKVYECTNIDLITYANETNYIVESGVLSPKTTLKVHNNISNVVSLLQKKVSLLESNMTKYMITQNRLQLSSTHSADSVTFKVDYTVCSENMSQENYDTDLYNLILNNILVGKDNYDYDHMFNIIMDYASWSQISWDQFDILVGLMDIQHNPPIEEMPTDDEIVEETPNEIM